MGNTVEAGYVLVTCGPNAGIYVQVPDPDSRWGFYIADAVGESSQSWDGGFGLTEGHECELLDGADPRITPKIRKRLGWLLE